MLSFIFYFLIQLYLQRRTFGSQEELDLKDSRDQNELAREIEKIQTKKTVTTELKLQNFIFLDEGAQALCEWLKQQSALRTLQLFLCQFEGQSLSLLCSVIADTKLINLELYYCQLFLTGVEPIANLLAHNVTLKSLELVGNQITPEQVSVIADSLKHNTSLTELNLASNKTGSSGTRLLAESLSKNTTLKKLDLESNEIDDMGVEFLKELIKKCKVNFGGNNINERENQRLHEFRDHWLKVTSTTRKVTHQFKAAYIGTANPWELVNQLKDQVEKLQIQLQQKDENSNFDQDQASQNKYLLQENLTLRQKNEDLAAALEIMKQTTVGIPNNHISFASKIGEGAFSEVYKAKWNDKNVAIKKLRQTVVNQNIIVNESKTLTLLHHPQIVQLLGTTTDPATNETMIVMEYMKCGSLQNLLKQRSLLKSEVIQIALDVAKGLHYLHYMKIIHRDLKSDNILLCHKHTRAKISDFGTARLFINPNTNLTAGVGTVAFMAPELIDEKPYSEKADIYSFGIVLYQMIVHKPPPVKVSETHLKDLCKENVSKIFAELQQLILNCCKQDPTQRPTTLNCIKLLKQLKKNMN